MNLSKKQISSMELISKLCDQFGNDRWFTQHELSGVTKHTMDALISKGCLVKVTYEGILYYHRTVVRPPLVKEPDGE